ncbi:Eco57I restriction-modification methylase domain-containing protein [Methanobrevibacter sp.]
MTTEAKIENNLFNDKKMEEFIELYDDALTIQADCDPISYWIKKLEQDELRSEKTNYIKFFKIILENILGYEFTDIKYEENIGDEGRPVEFTLKKDNKDYVVVELKGTTCKDLNKRYNREQSPIEQVTNYASIKEDTQWAFVSNYNEFRLFNPSYREKYISFKFTQLTDPDVLKKFLLIFSKFSLIEKDIPQTLLKETRIIERDLEDEFYKLFSETRLMLIKELEYSSDEIDRIEAIRLAQLILNRFIFLCFAEDLRLIPSETTADVLLTPIKHRNLFEFTMWDRLNELFRFADSGNEERGIGAFNGGLFKENLRHLEIRDKIEDLTFFSDCYKTWKFEEKYEEIENLLDVYKDTLNPIFKNLLIISSFDFGSELSVNILGHIFENSIGDIEDLKDETTQRRRQDGVFYTPEPITDYICRNTIIPYLSKSGKATTIHQLISEYEDTDTLDELDEALHNIKIIDIACGSGAFLNKAVDILFEIHKAFHDSKYAKDNTLNKYFDSLDSRKQIIQNNIYGVDVNEESVEITKLSLFLKLATTTGIIHGFKLPNLDKNIKCGNSIIYSDEYAGDKSFNWESEFKDMLDNGGFDIVIGNPPYVRQELISKYKPYLNDNYETYKGTADLYVYFIEKGLKLLKKNGIYSVICSSKFTKTGYGKLLRKFIITNYDINLFEDYSTSQLFSDATTYPCIIKITNNKTEDNEIFVDRKYFMKQNRLTENAWVFKSEKILKIKDKLDSHDRIKDNPQIKINRGFSTGCNDAFVINNEKKEQLIAEDPNNSKYLKPVLRGKDLKKWEINYEGLYLIYSPWNIEIDNLNSLKKHLDSYYEPLSTRAEVKQNRYPWYCLSRYNANAYDDFEKPKLVYSRMVKNFFTVYDEKGYFLLDSAFIITSIDNNKQYLKGVSAILSSKVIDFYISLIVDVLRGSTYAIKKIYIEQIPLPELSEDIELELSILVDNIQNKQYSLSAEISNFIKWIRRTFNLENISNKLLKYYELDFNLFFKEITKITNILQREKQELLENEFNNSLNIVFSLQNEIQELESKINEIVYQLYELAPEEIAIIENSFNG